MNDGSTDGTAELIRAQLPPNAHLLDLPQNLGKGGAVREGILHARTLPFYSRLGWIGYWDADLATPLSELDRFFKYRMIHPREVDALMGSRIYKLGARIERSAVRHVLGRFFATVVGTLFRLRSYDSQCGAKLFRPAVVEQAFALPLLSRWAFDVEILLRLEDSNVVECPLLAWKDVRGSKFRPLRDAWRVGVDLIRLWWWARRRLRSGAPDPAAAAPDRHGG